MQICEKFHDYIVQCEDTLQVNALLEPATQYQWVLKDKFQKEYSGVTTSDGDGFLQIPVEDLPAGLFTSYSGDFNLMIYKYTDLCRPVNFKMAKYYDAICFEVKPGTLTKNNLGCDFDCSATSGGGGNSAVFPFTDISTLTVEWTELLNSLYGSAPTVQVYLLTSPGQYTLTSVGVTMNQTGYVLDSIDIDMGGNATGYVLMS